MAGPEDVRDDAAEQPQGPPPVPPGSTHVVELSGEAVPVRPLKPLGPRRLARLQRELAERSRELEQAGVEAAGPELLEKQQRFAELAARAGAANADPADGADVQQHQAADPVPPVATEPRRGVPEAAPAGPVERITVVFPDARTPGGPDGHVAHDPVHVDPALFSSRLAPEELAALTHIQIVGPGVPEQAGPPADAPEREDPGDLSGPPAGAPDPPLPEGAPDPSGPVGSSAAQEPPAAPVPATSAGGLELLDPREYRRRTGVLGLLLPAVVAALVVVLVLFLL